MAIGSIRATDIKRRDFRNFYNALAKIDSHFASHTQIRKDSFVRMKGFDKVTGSLSTKGLAAMKKSLGMARLNGTATLGALYSSLLKGRTPDWAFKILYKVLR